MCPRTAQHAAQYLFTAATAACLAPAAAGQATVPFTDPAWADFGTTNVTGVTGNFLPGWTTIQSTPDLGDDLFFNPSQSLSGLDGDAALWFLQFAPGSSSPGSNEIAELSLSGFTPGESYSLDFFATVMEYSFAGWSGDADEIDVTLTGADISSWQTTTLEDPGDADNMNSWVAQSLAFTAVGSTVTFRFNDDPFDADPTTIARFAIDGVRIAPVPAPASLTLLGLGTIATIRRRRPTRRAG